jgi:NOL1/NOP2/fmu family ribosome biogenesis protein
MNNSNTETGRNLVPAEQGGGAVVEAGASPQLVQLAKMLALALREEGALAAPQQAEIVAEVEKAEGGMARFGKDVLEKGAEVQEWIIAKVEEQIEEHGSVEAAAVNIALRLEQVIRAAKGDQAGVIKSMGKKILADLLVPGSKGNISKRVGRLGIALGEIIEKGFDKMRSGGADAAGAAA